VSIIEEMRGEFLAEAQELLDEINTDLLHLEEGDRKAQSERLWKVMRAAHSLKGSSGMFGLDDVSAASHSLESLLEDLQTGETAGAADLIEASVDLVEVMRQFLREATAVSGTDSGAEDGSAKNPDGPEPAGSPGPATGGEGEKDAAQFVRIDLSNLDAALNLVGDLFLETTQLRRLQKAEIQGQARRGAYRRQLGSTRLIERRLSELRVSLLEMRMVPLGRVFQRLIPAVQSVAKQKNKQVDLVIEGGETRLDKVMADGLSDSLMHLIRNAIDHGVEEPSEREKLGKPAGARVSLCARREGAEVIIEVSDDGRGVVLDRVLAKAVSKGLLPENAPVSERQILECLFVRGFSTAGEVDAVSGRGVGMDVVQANVSRLSGSVSIETLAGKGTAVTIRVPPTLSTMDGLLVGVAGQILVLPFYCVTDVIRVPVPDREQVLEEGSLVIREELIRSVSLGAVLGLVGEPEEDLLAVVVGRDSDRFAILVDALGERTEILVKPLGPKLDPLPGLSGVTELADGRAALVLDVASLAKGVLEVEGIGA